MTVEELIEELKKYPLNSTVMIHGYEGGYKDVSELEKATMRLDINSAWYYGPHEKEKGIDIDERKTHKRVKAIIIE